MLAVSPATIDRLLAPTREAVRGKRRRPRKPSAARASVPIRTASDWNEPPPGFMEVDLVAHCGGSMVGSVAHRLVLTDIASGWTECVALAVREGSLVVDGVDRLYDAMPFPLLGIDTDNGGEFINEAMVALCQAGNRIHPVSAVSKERPSLGGAEERLRRSPTGGLWEARGYCRSGGARSALQRFEAVRQLLPTFVQAAGQAPGRLTDQQAISHARDAV